MAVAALTLAACGGDDDSSGAASDASADDPAVVATTTWAALKGRDALEIDWEPGPNADDSSEKFWKENAAMLDTDGQVVTDDGEFDDAMAAADKIVSHRYEVPFVSHQPMEPQNCFAHVREDSCHIIVPTQMPSGASRAAAAQDATIAERPVRPPRPHAPTADERSAHDAFIDGMSSPIWRR